MAGAAAPIATPPHAVRVRAAATHAVAPTLHALDATCHVPAVRVRAARPRCMPYARRSLSFPCNMPMCVVTVSFPVRRGLVAIFWSPN